MKHNKEMCKTDYAAMFVSWVIPYNYTAKKETVIFLVTDKYQWIETS